MSTRTIQRKRTTTTEMMMKRYKKKEQHEDYKRDKEKNNEAVVEVRSRDSGGGKGSLKPPGPVSPEHGRQTYGRR